MAPGSRYPDPVLLFDGECGLCQRLIRFLLRLDRRGRLRFAPLQGPAAQDFLSARALPTTDFETLVFVDDWAHRAGSRFLVRSTGVIAALRTIGGVGTILAGALVIIPAPLRDSVYRVIGHWRYRLFGPWRPRPWPRPEWQARFLT